MLATFGSTTEQDDEGVALFAEVNPVTWSLVDDVFTHAKSARLDIREAGSRGCRVTLQTCPSCKPIWLDESRASAAEVGAWVSADFREFDSMRRGPMPQSLPPDQRPERKELRYRVWVNSVLKPLCAVLECLIVRFFDQVPGVKAIESYAIESKLAPSL